MNAQEHRLLMGLRLQLESIQIMLDAILGIPEVAEESGPCVHEVGTDLSVMGEASGARFICKHCGELINHGSRTEVEAAPACDPNDHAGETTC